MNKKQKKDFTTIIVVVLLAMALMFAGCHPPQYYCPANNFYGYIHNYNHCNRVAY